MSNPHGETLVPKADVPTVDVPTVDVPTVDEFLTTLEEAYHSVKRMRRSIRMDDSLDGGLGLDSLSAMELLLALEQEYGITLIGTTEVTRIRTVAELHALVAELASVRAS